MSIRTFLRMLMACFLYCIDKDQRNVYRLVFANGDRSDRQKKGTHCCWQHKVRVWYSAGSAHRPPPIPCCLPPHHHILPVG